MTELKTRDRTGDFIPIYAAVNLANLPRTDDGSVTNSQLMASLRKFRQELVTKETLISRGELI